MKHRTKAKVYKAYDEAGVGGRQGEAGEKNRQVCKEQVMSTPSNETGGATGR